MASFNIRVYGILLNPDGGVLISDEFERNTRFTKFPGGGMEIGESTIEALKREFMEECSMEIKVGKHLYTTDFYVRSIFNDSQVISIYYQVFNVYPIELGIKTRVFDFEGTGETLQSFRWVLLKDLTPEMMTFETEKKMVEILISEPGLIHPLKLTII